MAGGRRRVPGTSGGRCSRLRQASGAISRSIGLQLAVRQGVGLPHRRGSLLCRQRDDTRRGAERRNRLSGRRHCGRRRRVECPASTGKVADLAARGRDGSARRGDAALRTVVAKDVPHGICLCPGQSTARSPTRAALCARGPPRHDLGALASHRVHHCDDSASAFWMARLAGLSDAIHAADRQQPGLCRRTVHVSPSFNFSHVSRKDLVWRCSGATGCSAGPLNSSNTSRFQRAKMHDR